ncbi:MAG: N-acetyltransferase [Ignavibacteriales bacterium]|nr:N-acetyltransferase [Ignavibacteriales bacterium]
MNVTIRQEAPADYEAVQEIVRLAFLAAPHADGTEHLLVERLRKSKHFIPALSLVAEVDGRCVGHILFSTITIRSGNIVHESLALAPVSVLPDLQRTGIGGKLIGAGHAVARQLGCDSIILVGHAEYYPRFGYRPASTWGITSSFDVPDECFMALELVPGALSSVSGVVEYPAEFGT